MILPSKHLPEHRCLLSLGANILAQLDQPRAVSELWERVRRSRNARSSEIPLSFDLFVLAVTFLHAIFAVDLKGGLVVRSKQGQ